MELSPPTSPRHLPLGARAAAIVLACLLVLPPLTAASADEDASDEGGGQGNRIVLLAADRQITFADGSDPASSGWSDLFPSGASDVLAGFPGNVAVRLASEGALMRLPSFDGIVEPHSDGDQWSTGSSSLAFVTDRDRVNEILRGLQLDLEPGSGSCARVSLQVEQHGRGNVKGSVDALIEGCVAGATLAAPGGVDGGVAQVFGTVPLGGAATPHPGFTLDTATTDVCSIEAVAPPSGEGVMEPFTAQLRLSGVGGDCIVRLRYLDDSGSPFGPQDTMTLPLGGLSVAAAGGGPGDGGADGASAIVGRVVPQALTPAVQVVDPHGDAVAGVEVTFAVTSGAGSVSPATVLTGADGVAVAGAWVLGTTAGVNRLSATVHGHPPVVFEVLGESDAPARLEVVRGAGQLAVAGSAVPVAPAVRVTDEHGNRVAGAEVRFEATVGGGSVSPTTAVTDQDGVAVSGGWTLGLDPGPNVLTATVTVDGPELPAATVATTLAATGSENLVVSTLRDRTLADAFVTVRGQALAAGRATLRVSATAASSDSDVCAVRPGSLRIPEEGLLVPFSAVIELLGAAGRCELELTYGADEAGSGGVSPAVRRVGFAVQAVATEVMPPPPPSDAPAAVDGLAPDGQAVVGFALTVDANRDNRASLSAWVQSTAGEAGDGTGDGGEDDGVELLDRVDVWVAAPLAQAGDALLLAGDEQLVIDGEGFEPGSAVALYLFSEPTFVGTATVDEHGAFVGSFVVPAELARDATHTLRLVGYSRIGNAWTLAAPVWLASAAPATTPVTPSTTPLVVTDAASLALPAESSGPVVLGPSDRASALARAVRPGGALVPSGLEAALGPAALTPGVQRDVGRSGAASSIMDDITLRSMLRDAGVVGCPQEATGPSTRQVGWTQLGGAGQVLAVTSWSLPGLWSWFGRSACDGVWLGSAGTFGLTLLLVATILLLAWRRRDAAEDDARHDVAAGTA